LARRQLKGSGSAESVARPAIVRAAAPDLEDEPLVRLEDFLAVPVEVPRALPGPLVGIRLCCPTFGERPGLERLGTVTGTLLWEILARRGRWDRRRKQQQRRPA
jgi:hypothetical protein